MDDVNLAIAEGMFVTIIGSSGCGKTTLLKMVNALVMPDEGEVLVHGRATSNADPIGLRRNIGYAIQGSVLFPHLTVEQNIAYVPTLLNSGDEDRTEAVSYTHLDVYKRQARGRRVAGSMGSYTTTAPMGTSPSSSARRASSIARRI